ncbi:MAG: MFS transporter [Rhodobacterales bacterium]|jgi:MFS family permease|tara:strand:- start:428 stop:1621 length:1194 start_codon:yes stop_codon:yes gene_type:complete
MKNYFFILFAAGAIQSVVFGGRQTIPLSIEGINLASTVNYLEISFAFAVGQLISGAVTPLGGVISDKYGSGKTLLLGIVISTLGCFLIPFSTTPLMLVLSIGILSAGGSGIAGLPVIMSAVNKLVPPEKSGMAFGFVNAGGSVGQFLFAPLAGLMIINYGWQASIFAICALLLMILPLVWILRHQPEKKKKIQAGDNLTLSKALSLAFNTPSYILLISGFFVCGFHVAFIITHMPGVIVACGLSVNVTGWSLAVIGFFNILGSLYAGWHISKRSMKIFLSYIYGARAIIVILFLLSPKDITSIMLFSAALGFTYLSTVPATAALVGKMFGPKYLATLFGITLFSHNIGAFFGAYFGGYFFQMTGEYTIVWLIDIGLAIFAALIHLPIKEKSALPVGA